LVQIPAKLGQRLSGCEVPSKDTITGPGRRGALPMALDCRTGAIFSYWTTLR
jgi:hypothetical protein